MSRRVTPDQRKTEYLKRGMGDPEIDVSNYVMYESRIVTTEPLSKGGFLNKARISPTVLYEMRDQVNSESGAIPMQIMHETSNLPVGKLFHTEVKGNVESGETELYGLFYVSKSEPELLTKIDEGTIDEVSVGVRFKHAFCSECGFDYLGPDADLMHHLELTCPEGHTIGVEGVHVRLSGLEDFSELSLVGTGAAKNPKILPRSKQSLSKEEREKLSAYSDSAYAASFVNAKFKLTNLNEEGETEMEVKDFIDKLETLSSELATVKVTLGTKEAEVTDLTAKLKEANDKIAELEAAKGQTDEEVKTQLSKLEEEVAEANKILDKHVQAALGADGDKDTKMPETISAKLALVEEKGLKLHQLFGADTGAQGKKVEKKEDANLSDDTRFEAFKLNKK